MKLDAEEIELLEAYESGKMNPKRPSKALQKGIPYQALIAGLIHQYVEGDLHESSK